MMVTRAVERKVGRPPTQEELIELWNLMVEADRDSRSDSIYAAKRLVRGMGRVDKYEEK